MKTMFRNGMIAAAVALTAGLSGTSQAATIIVDDFSSGTLVPYTQTTILDQNTTRNTSFSAASNGLTATSNGSPTVANAEQTLLLRSDFNLAVNQQLRADISGFITGTSQDFAIAVSSTATPAGVAAGASGDTRVGQFYGFVGVRTNVGQVISAGANGATFGPNQDQTNNAVAVTQLFITRLSATDFQFGFSRGAADINVGPVITFANANVGSAIGFYADQRLAGTLQTLDNLRIVDVPEPASMALLGLGAMGLIRRRRA